MGIVVEVMRAKKFACILIRVRVRSCEVIDLPFFVLQRFSLFHVYIHKDNRIDLLANIITKLV